LLLKYPRDINLNEELLLYLSPEGRLPYRLSLLLQTQLLVMSAWSREFFSQKRTTAERLEQYLIAEEKNLRTTS
jgi:hypothetical protein